VVWKRSRDLGFYGITLPKALGGAGFSIVDHVLIKEFIYASGSPLAPHVLGELTGPPRVGALAKQATPDQMERFILPVARAEKAICFAITEPEAGSDAGACRRVPCAMATPSS
jgi:alkylation response protein AidB-like acyl-CoA dehydrogenase